MWRTPRSVSAVQFARTALVRLERPHQLINLRGALLDPARLADLTRAPQRTGLFEQVFTHIGCPEEHRFLRRIVASVRACWLVLCGHVSEHTPPRRLRTILQTR